MSRKARTHRLRLLSPIFAGILCFFLCCAPADALTLYDDFSGQYIQALQWSTTDFVREVQNGALRSRLRLFRDSDTNTLFMNAPGLAAHIEADVTLVAASSVTDGYAYARLGKSLYNNGQGASGS